VAIAVQYPGAQQGSIASTSDSSAADPPSFTTYTGKQLTQFRELSVDEVQQLLFSYPLKTCSLDPLPTDILLKSVDTLLPVICEMCNASLREGLLPISEEI